MDVSPVHIGRQAGLMQADKIHALPGQPAGVDFDQYAGYVTVDPVAGRALFYYFVESPHHSPTKPLVLWLNGGPGCSSLGYGALEELGPFRVKSDGKTLYRNDYAWNNVANVIFLESPAGVGFSYSHNSSHYINAGDKSTAKDSYTFLVNWLERFPQYKARDLFIAGENYAGHYVPELALTIVTMNNRHHTRINLKGIAIGNAWIDDITGTRGRYEYYWSHALISDDTIAGIRRSCDFATGWRSPKCDLFQRQVDKEIGLLHFYNIYAPLCSLSPPKSGQTASVNGFDPCSNQYVATYLNLPEVQRALHAKATKWAFCRDYSWDDRPISVLPTINHLIYRRIRTWIYSGDTDAVVPVTSTRFAVNKLNLTVNTTWRPWYSSTEIGGYVVGFDGLTFITIRGAGHTVPSYQPERALTMISSFLQGKLPPTS
ncbi:hypothetical protein SLA2020_431350 [Shorea laevis]